MNRLVFLLFAVLSFSNLAAFPQAPAESAAQKYFTDVELIDQDGRKLRLYTDLMKGRVVIINSFYAACTGSCPAMNQRLEKIQSALGKRLGQDIFLISVSVDPVADTPAILKEYAKKWNARPGRFFLTGDKANVDLVLGKLGQMPGKREDHSTVWAIGNDRTGLWKRVMGLSSADDLIKEVETVLNDKGPDSNKID